MKRVLCALKKLNILSSSLVRLELTMILLESLSMNPALLALMAKLAKLDHLLQVLSKL